MHTHTHSIPYAYTTQCAVLPLVFLGRFIWRAHKIYTHSTQIRIDHNLNKKKKI